MNAAHDIVHDWRASGVIHAPRFSALFRIVFCKKRLVKLNNGVFAGFVFNKFLTDTRNFGCVQLVHDKLCRFEDVWD